MSNECLFCRIAQGEIGELIYEDETVVAFRDISPVAPIHALIIPRKHIATINDLEDEDAKIIGDMYLAAKTLAAKENLTERGYRCVMNCNADGGQSVFHIHLHLLGGQAMGWPPF